MNPRTLAAASGVLLVALALAVLLSGPDGFDAGASDARDMIRMVDVGFVGAWDPEREIRIFNDTDETWDVLGVAITCWTQDVSESVPPGQDVVFRYTFPSKLLSGPLQMPGHVQTRDGQLHAFTITAFMVPLPRLETPRVTVDLAIDQPSVTASAAWLQPRASVEPVLRVVQGSSAMGLSVGRPVWSEDGQVRIPLSMHGPFPLARDDGEFRWVIEDRTSGVRLTQHLSLRREILCVDPSREVLLGTDAEPIRVRLADGAHVASVVWRGRSISWRRLASGLFQVALPNGSGDGLLEVRDDLGRLATVSVVRLGSLPGS